MTYLYFTGETQSLTQHYVHKVCEGHWQKVVSDNTCCHVPSVSS